MKTAATFILLLCASCAAPVAVRKPAEQLVTAPAVTTNAPAAGTDKGLDEARDLIRQLGAGDYKKRVGAEARLRELGDKAIEALQESRNTDDPEVALRVRKLLSDTLTELHKGQFIGKWHTSLDWILTMNADGSWQAVEPDGATSSGKWLVRGDNVVWLRDCVSYIDEEPNPIIQINRKQIKVQKPDGTIRTYDRVEDK